LIRETVTAPPKRKSVPNPDSAVRTSAPNSVFASCWMRMLNPNVARMEVNRSFSTTRKITAR